jgi:hypothetical protein
MTRRAEWLVVAALHPTSWPGSAHQRRRRSAAVEAHRGGGSPPMSSDIPNNKVLLSCRCWREVAREALLGELSQAVIPIDGGR